MRYSNEDRLAALEHMVSRLIELLPNAAAQALWDEIKTMPNGPAFWARSDLMIDTALDIDFTRDPPPKD